MPDDCVLMLAGLPASGKTSFGRYLAATADFAHYDMENHPTGWPRPDLKAVWDREPLRFLEQVKAQHRRVILDWGFPPGCEALVLSLQAAGVRLVWFDGDEAAARASYVERSGPQALPMFDRQVAAMRDAGYPGRMRCDVVGAIDAGGHHRNLEEIAAGLFGGSSK